MPLAENSSERHGAAPVNTQAPVPRSQLVPLLSRSPRECLRASRCAWQCAKRSRSSSVRPRAHPRMGPGDGARDRARGGGVQDGRRAPSRETGPNIGK
eukprot:3323901-Pleurochrysis_carterae.AAC.3